MLIGFTGYVGLITAFTQSHALWLSLGTLASAGLFFGFATALNTTVFLLLVREDMRGRGMAAWQMAGGVSPLGALPMGLAITRFGPQIGVGAFTGTCFLCFVGITAFWRTLRDVRAQPLQPRQPGRPLPASRPDERARPAIASCRSSGIGRAVRR